MELQPPANSLELDIHLDKTLCLNASPIIICIVQIGNVKLHKTPSTVHVTKYDYVFHPSKVHVTQTQYAKYSLRLK